MCGVGWGDWRWFQEAENGRRSLGFAAPGKAEQETRCLETFPVVALFPHEQSLEVLPPPPLRQRNPGLEHVTR